jgi:hypothetical protein
VLRCAIDWRNPRLAALDPDLGLRLQFKWCLIEAPNPDLDEAGTGTSCTEEP